MNRFEFWRDHCILKLTHGEEILRSITDEAADITVFNYVTTETKTYQVATLIAEMGIDIPTFESDIKRIKRDRSLFTTHESDSKRKYGCVLDWYYNKPLPIVIDIPSLDDYTEHDILKIAIKMYRLQHWCNQLHVKGDNLIFGINRLKKNMELTKTLKLDIAKVATLPEDFINSLPKTEHLITVAVTWDRLLKMLSERATKLVRLGFIVYTICLDGQYETPTALTERVRILLSLLKDVNVVTRGNDDYIIIKTDLVPSGEIDITYQTLLGYSAYTKENKGYQLDFGDNVTSIDNSPKEDFLEF